jgi:4-hydroxybenzoate polyprenyltransferase
MSDDSLHRCLPASRCQRRAIPVAAGAVSDLRRPQAAFSQHTSAERRRATALDRVQPWHRSTSTISVARFAIAHFPGDAGHDLALSQVSVKIVLCGSVPAPRRPKSIRSKRCFAPSLLNEKCSGKENGHASGTVLTSYRLASARAEALIDIYWNVYFFPTDVFASFNIYVSRSMHVDVSDQRVEISSVTVPPLSLDLAFPLVLDLDGTLFATDTFHESLILFLRKHPSDAWRIPGWVLSGRAVAKERLAIAVAKENIAHFPINVELVAFAEREAARGRRVVLATAADRVIADKAGGRFPFIAEIIASDGSENLKGEAKARKLMTRFPDGFVYAGDSPVDLHIWCKASGAIVVGAPSSLERKVRASTPLLATFPGNSAGASAIRRSLRLHQWAKNALVFVPLVLSGKALDPTAWLLSAMGFVAIGLLASATYVLNDLWDLADDRQHWSKKRRPLASGDLSIAFGFGLIAVAGLGAFALGLAIGTGAAAVLAIYLALSLAYSFRLKREPIIDVFVLATLFTMRLALGMVVVGAALSPWLIVFSMFIFLSLSLAKRQTEIARMVENGRERTLGRGYRDSDVPLVLAIGISTMMATVLIMVIYLIDDAFPTGFYRHPDMLWGFPIIIFLFLARIWLLCHRGELHDDPVAFALKDRISLLHGAAMVALFVVAIA